MVNNSVTTVIQTNSMDNSLTVISPMNQKATPRLIQRLSLSVMALMGGGKGFRTFPVIYGE